jgi:hypothetical protein
MKKILSIASLFFIVSSISAQEGAKKYVLIEHFTNSRCGICASRNPAFYNLIGQAQYADDIHHIAVHPMFPYPQCIFYQANTAENAAWTALYPVSGTPTIVLNGAIQPNSNPLLTEAKLLTFLGQTSPLHLQVTESGPNNAREVNVKAKAFGEIPAGNYKIFVAVAEKTVNQQTPNGESVHHDVFRKMLTAVSGNTFEVPNVGETKEFNYQFSIPATWNADEVYALAFVKEVDTKQVLNSGTRFDPLLSGTGGATQNTIEITPNPVADIAWAMLSNDTPQSLELYASNGQQVPVAFETQGNVFSVQTGSLAPGVYFLKVRGRRNNYVGKFVR